MQLFGSPSQLSDAIDSRDVLALQWLYQHPKARGTGFWIFGQTKLFKFIEFLIPIYTPGISSLPLRHALLCFVDRILSIPETSRWNPNHQVATIPSHESCKLSQARRALLKKQPAQWDEADIFATSFLAALAPTANEFKIHAKGCISIMRHITSSVMKQPRLTQFWSLAVEFMLYYGNPKFLSDHEFFCLYLACNEAMTTTTPEDQVGLLHGGLDLVVGLLLHRSALGRVVQDVLGKGIERTTTTNVIAKMEAAQEAFLEEHDIYGGNEDELDLKAVFHCECQLLLAVIRNFQSTKQFTPSGLHDASSVLIGLVLKRIGGSKKVSEELQTYYRDAICFVMLGQPCQTVMHMMVNNGKDPIDFIKRS